MTHRIFLSRQHALGLTAVHVLLTLVLGVFASISMAQTPAESRKPGQPVTLNFNNADIEAVARTMASITGFNVVVDPRVKGTLTLVTEKPVSSRMAMNQFLAALRLQGFTMVESAGLYKVVPEADAKLQSGAVAVDDAGAGNQISTQIFRLNFESANNLVPILRPLISPNNTINANPANNSLVITDYGDNLRRIARIIAAMDVSNATDVEVLPLKHAIASDLAPLVLRLMDSAGTGIGAVAGQIDSSFKTLLVAEPRSNTLILRAANQARVALVKSLVDKLDQPPAQGSNGAAGNIYVVYLKNADATKLAATLRAAMAGEARPASAATGASPAMALPGASATTAGGQVQADPATNALIITAPEPQYRQLRAVIDKLDARRAQVFVESLIAEVSVDRAAEFGIQWQGALGKNGDGVIGLLGTNFGAGAKNIVNLATQGATGTVTPARGLNLGAAQQTNGVYVLGFLARFLEESGSGNVLSTPNLLTLDNEEAKIVIGQNVPFVTGQFTNTGSGANNGTVNPFQTIERKDVGLTLKVKPQISENGTVKLAIYQEVSSVLAATANAANGPTTNKRTIESNVLVEDGAVVVLGGLLQDEYSGNQEKVPGLGDIPFFGNLFKSEARARKKTNLMVFLRPVVVRDAQSTERLSVDRYDLMRSGLKDAQPVPSTMVPINEAPQLPALPVARPASAPVAPAAKPQP
ncbi:type II secretion system secretin GspD [Rhodoferax sp.]|uniref:type II secretion system secretin GspD n=1 Tax=Rhodoferax sp. TaxID=50421 RepID=UPI001EB37FA7|nr:type II secretion system secretin GspD [Rhodoferax sp.]MBT9508333.1 type II secretion system secretin GspD [Rhodoferax sp.]